jgi:hypothetical protein
MSDDIIYIYGLYSTRKKSDIRYVGQTRDIRVRYLAHTRPLGTDHSDKAFWVRKEVASGYEIFMKELEKVPYKLRDVAERYWIDRLTNEGKFLFNNDMKTKERKKNLLYNSNRFFSKFIFPFFVIFVVVSIVHMVVLRHLWIWDYAYLLFTSLFALEINNEKAWNKNINGTGEYKRNGKI